ncbi:MAG: hypothetical protein H6601_12100 [Flavobacteriales bacterium]|nr:hypothetical protein [Flavobacteriales bacterium]MCB9192839.1 hypothetical protein [Flavobacteriales bacterium]
MTLFTITITPISPVITQHSLANERLLLSGEGPLLNGEGLLLNGEACLLNGGQPLLHKEAAYLNL